MNDNNSTDYGSRLSNYYCDLLSKEGLANQCVGFWAFNAVWGAYGKDIEYVTPAFVKDALLSRGISISDELAQCIIDLWVYRGQITHTVKGYRKMSLKSA